MTRLLLVSIGFVYIPLFSVSSVLAEECNQVLSVSSSQVVENVANQCCGASNSRRCIARNLKKARNIRGLISRDVFGAIRSGLRQLRQSGCSPALAKGLICTASSSATATEIVDNLRNTACTRQFQSEREKALKRGRRAWVKARNLMDSGFSEAVRGEVRSLLGSKSCGQGGEKATARCGRVVNPRDGFKVGNVYTQGEYSRQPVFVTHNGARSGQVITISGEVIRNLRYTGLANPDPKGLRHHYRIDQSCSSLPPTFLLRIGGTCYEINDRCGRVD